MSYDVYISMKTGDSAESFMCQEVGNMTSNVACMWRAGGCDLRELDGKPAAECVPVIRSAVMWMTENADACRGMEPDNGWGSYESALEFLVKVLAACCKHSLGTLKVSY
jgi:hypothetical protein